MLKHFHVLSYLYKWQVPYPRVMYHYGSMNANEWMNEWQFLICPACQPVVCSLYWLHSLGSNVWISVCISRGRELTDSNENMLTPSFVCSFSKDVNSRALSLKISEVNYSSMHTACAQHCILRLARFSCKKCIKNFGRHTIWKVRKTGGYMYVDNCTVLGSLKFLGVGQNLCL